MTFDQAVNFLYGREKFGWVLGLDSMRNALADLGNPQNGPNYVHIAGTNGKGSVAVMTESILRHAGYTTGLFTSPHLVQVRERIQINGNMITENDFARLMNQIAPVVQKYECTFFETLTILAFVYFYENQIEYVCLEVGLGGRLDATNVITPIATVVTSIGLDHTEHLGSSYAEIAAEKFGIVKPQVACVIGELPKEAVDVGLEVCRSMNSDCYLSDTVSLQILEQTDSYSTVKLTAEEQLFRIPFAGRQQIRNFQIVVRVFEKLDLPITPQMLAYGLKNAKWPGRFQRVNTHPTVFVDVAHNPDSMQSFIQTVKKFYKNRNTTCLFAVLQDKAYKKISEMLVDAEFRLIPLHLQASRALPAHQLYEYLVSIKADVLPPMTIKDSVEYVYKQKSNRLFCYTGSHYTIGQVLRIINNLTN